VNLLLMPPSLVPPVEDDLANGLRVPVLDVVGHHSVELSQELAIFYRQELVQFRRGEEVNGPPQALRRGYEFRPIYKMQVSGSPRLIGDRELCGGAFVVQQNKGSCIPPLSAHLAVAEDRAALLDLPNALPAGSSGGMQESTFGHLVACAAPVGECLQKTARDSHDGSVI